MKHSNLYLGLVLPSGGWQSLIGSLITRGRIRNISFFQARVFHDTWLEKLAMHKRSSLLGPLIRFLKILCAIGSGNWTRTLELKNISQTIYLYKGAPGIEHWSLRSWVSRSTTKLQAGQDCLELYCYFFLLVATATWFKASGLESSVNCSTTMLLQVVIGDL